MDETEWAMKGLLARGRSAAFLALWRQVGSPERPIPDKRSWLEWAISKGCVGAVKGMLQDGRATGHIPDPTLLWRALTIPEIHTRYVPAARHASLQASIVVLLIQAGADPMGAVLPSAHFYSLCLDDRRLLLVEALEARLGRAFFHRATQDTLTSFEAAAAIALSNRSPQILGRVLTWIEQERPRDLAPALARLADDALALRQDPGCIRVLAQHGHDWAGTGTTVNGQALNALATLAHQVAVVQQRSQWSVGPALWSLPAQPPSPVEQWLPCFQALWDSGADRQATPDERLRFLIEMLWWREPELAPLQTVLIEEAIDRGWRFPEPPSLTATYREWIKTVGRWLRQSPQNAELALRTWPRLGMALTSNPFEGLPSSTWSGGLPSSTWGGFLWDELAQKVEPTPERQILLAPLAQSILEHRLDNGDPLVHAPVSAAWIQWLLAHGADLEARNQEGLTPLQKAAHQGKAAWLSDLVQAGALFPARSEAHALTRLALHSRDNGTLRKILTLLPPEPGEALWQTAFNGWEQGPRPTRVGLISPEEVATLEAAGADWTARDNHGRTGLEVWVKMGMKSPLPTPSEMGQAMEIEDAQGDWPAEAVFRRLQQRQIKGSLVSGISWSAPALATLLSHGARLRCSRFSSPSFQTSLAALVDEGLISKDEARLWTLAATKDLDAVLPHAGQPERRPRM